MPNIRIDENVERELIDYIISESFIPKPELTLSVVKFLDDNFRAGLTVDVNDGSIGNKVAITQFIKQPRLMDVRTMNEEDLLTLLDDRFYDIITDKKDRLDFLKNVIYNWLNKDKKLKIGILSKKYSKKDNKLLNK